MHQPPRKELEANMAHAVGAPPLVRFFLYTGLLASLDHAPNCYSVASEHRSKYNEYSNQWMKVKTTPHLS